MISDISVRQHAPLVPRKETQKLVFDRRQLQFFTGQINAAGDIVDRQIAVMKDRVSIISAAGLYLRGNSALRDPDPRHQLFNGKRLRQIIVRSGVECADFVRILTPRADDDDRQIAETAYFADN